VAVNEIVEDDFMYHFMYIERTVAETAITSYSFTSALFYDNF